MLRTLYLIFCLLGFLPVMNMVVMAGEAAPTTESSPTILVWGDSLSAAYGIPVEKGWVNLLQEKLGDKYTVVNGSISGETTAGGLTRLPDALKAHKPAYVLLELGANDGLRGIALDEMRANLEQMVKLAQAADAKVVLIGIKLPPNYGPAFNDKFDAAYVELAQQYALPLVPFLLDGVADNWDLMQADGLHPTAEAEPKVLENVWKVLEGELPTLQHGG
ncbi:arylesterase [Candidatus Thiothrix sp. Deng01]|uniref:Arylesterase n=1 Tax=Candidatus Thiothrix phosphatis TaxID=3112415 RepID=A0ABU6CTI8_9GAMM|nr:arylesterase [Candidatus Thiothrix sp. Deng01]MEB4590156.1 arylesterase [Candidatus Thiothrix sp. Deng01]